MVSIIHKVQEKDIRGQILESTSSISGQNIFHFCNTVIHPVSGRDIHHQILIKWCDLCSLCMYVHACMHVSLSHCLLNRVATAGRATAIVMFGSRGTQFSRDEMPEGRDWFFLFVIQFQRLCWANVPPHGICSALQYHTEVGRLVER